MSKYWRAPGVSTTRAFGCSLRYDARCLKGVICAMTRLTAPAFAAIVILSLAFVTIAEVGAESHDDLSRVVGTRSEDPVPLPESLAFRCWPDVHDQIEPSAILLGENAEISATFAIAPRCRGGGWPVHTVLVLTGTEDRSRTSPARFLDLLIEIVEQYRVDEKQSWRMGIVVVDEDRARTVLPITGDRDKVLAALRRWHSSAGGTERGVSESFPESRLALARAAASLPPHDHPEVREIAILVGDIDGGHDCPEVTREASFLKRSGVLVIALCSAPGCLSECHRKVATSKRYIFEGFEGQLGRIFRILRNKDVFLDASRVDVGIDLSDSFEFVDDTAVPPPISWDSRRLHWSTGRSPYPRRVVTITYRVRSTVATPGFHPIAVRTIVSVWTNLDYPSYVVHRSVPSPRLLVLQPRLWPRP